MAYFQQALATEASFIDDLRTKLKDFLDNNQWFDECLAIRLAAEVRILCLKFSLNPLRFSLTRETDKISRAKNLVNLLINRYLAIW